jgi:hypothetical protein
VRLFTCPRCDRTVRFDASECPACHALLGYLPERGDIVELAPTDRTGTFTTTTAATQQWRCLNAAWGCNWLVQAASGTEWCQSCRLTHGRPDLTDPTAVEAWVTTEAAKRRVVHQLAALGLPVAERSPTQPRGLVFELVHVPGAAAVTGHLDGVITIDLTEADDVHREHLRHLFGEATRTLLGHIRHEIGHYYWPLLVEGAGTVEAFRDLFGDERTDYQSSLERHRMGQHPWEQSDHISAYAAAHPAEDWAETFAHYLLITDAVETAHSLGLGSDLPEQPSPAPTFRDLARAWEEVAATVAAVEEAVGSAALYPFSLSPRVLDKLEFADLRVRAYNGLGSW